MIELHTPQGVLYVDPATITDAELAALGLTREWADEQLAEEATAKELKLVIERLPDQGINKAWKRLLEKGILP